MNATGAVVFLPREGNGVSLMLEDLLFDPAALWLAQALSRAGVERFFVVCHTDDREKAQACFPEGTEFVTGVSEDAVEQLVAFLNELEGRVLVVTTAPGASRIAGMTMCRPLPERGGPIRRIESSTEAHTCLLLDWPSRNPTSRGSGSLREGRSVVARRMSCLAEAAVATSWLVAVPARWCGSTSTARVWRRHSVHAQAPAAPRRASMSARVIQ